MRDKKKNSNIALIISAILHLLVLVLLVRYENQQIKLANEVVEIEWVELKSSTPDQLKNTQIVQQDDKSVNEKTPEKDYKLSKNNQDVKKETKAEKNGEFQNRKNRVDAPKNKAQAMAKPATKQNILNSLKPSMYDSQYSSAKLAPPPTPAMSGAEVSQNDDYLKDVAAGAETLLRTREFVYYSYYNRIKRKLRQFWEPRIQKKIEKIMRKGRRIASANDKITHLVITLDRSGELVRIQVKHASGYNDLDDAAIEAFREAAPFPNPPKGIVTDAGEVKIPWSFVLET